MRDNLKQVFAICELQGLIADDEISLFLDLHRHRGLGGAEAICARGCG
jgi:hypothetical protein